MLFSLIFYKNENLVFRKRKSIDPSQDIWISYEELLLRGDCQIWFHKIKLFNFLLWLNPVFNFRFVFIIVNHVHLLISVIYNHDVQPFNKNCCVKRDLCILQIFMYIWNWFLPVNTLFLVFFSTLLEKNVCLVFLWITL